ncbi:MAG: phosphoenolpyruvate--protein phosphotransferase [Deltaproteobacteria bacterium]|nr:phosphoenolpyruvate--protein phosphotransferase [Deltaproteobacteria bacterium]
MTSTTATVDEHALRGLGVAPGVATGRVHLIDRRKKKHAKRRIVVAEVATEVHRLEGAWKDASELLNGLKDKAGEHSAILEAHLLMLEDPLFVDGARKHIVDDLQCAEWAIRSTVHEIRARFDALDNAYFRERRSDVDFVGDRLLDALGGDPAAGVFAGEHIAEDAIIVAHELSPGDAIALSRLKVRGFVTEVGGATSHTAILARALEIPAVIACKGVLDRAASGDEILVDGLRGEVVLSPTEAQRARFEVIKELHFARQSDLKADEGLEGETPDGRRVALLANVEVPDEVPGAVARGAGGVGLYRSEFLFLNRTEVPNVEEHEAACEAILAALGGRTATLRTFDLGSDKLSAAIRAPREQNPALGLRGVRLGLARQPALRAQLRGMVKALSRRRHGQILLPMIGSVEEVLAVRAILREEMDSLSDEGVDVWREIPVGVMIELPAAVWIADALAEVADFFSVGTNDLIQYMLAIDRGNEHVAHLYQPLHPAVLRALKHVVDAGHHAGRQVSLCGEMASDPAFAPVVLGLGFDSLSMPVASLRAVKHVLRRFRYDDAQALLKHCLAASTSAAVQKLVRKELILRGLYDAD